MTPVGGDCHQQACGTCWRSYSEGSVTDKKRIGFMPHYPAHEWYRTMISAMQTRARDLGFELVIAPPHQSISAEITRLREQIAQAACDALKAGGVHSDWRRRSHAVPR